MKNKISIFPRQYTIKIKVFKKNLNNELKQVLKYVKIDLSYMNF